MWNYRGHFKNKIIFCNCDDPTQSNFWKYFKDNFKRLGLKKLISTHYRPSTLFEDAPSYKLEYDGKNGHVKTPLKGDGDFRSAECAAVMQEADIVATNPPFSLLREFIKQVMKHDKKFLIIGNMNAVSYKEIFPLFAGNKIWLGYTPRGHEFMRPDGSLQAINSVWYTNLAHDKRHEKFRCLETYDPNKYPRYDNYPAIEVGRTNDIPKDYAGEMGVPITFLDKYNPDQFEIVGLCRYLLPDSRGGRFYVGGNQKYARIVIKHKKGK